MDLNRFHSLGDICDNLQPTNEHEAYPIRKSTIMSQCVINTNPEPRNVLEEKCSSRKHKKRRQSEDEDQNERPHFRIDWRQLSYVHTPKKWLKLRNKEDNNQQRVILNSLDGHFKSGQLSAILGPSGAGKSTFLATLFGARQDEASGQTRLTWHTSKSQGDKQRPLRVAFLPQQDHLLHHLTVYETLLFASKLKNNNTRSMIEQQNLKTTSQFHAANVRRVARMLKLTECLGTRCGKLSGGQYKRVSIGQELLSQPDVIILDEPTSGLDASTCLSTVRTLKGIVDNGRLPISIILTIHQPDSQVFNLFDRVYVIAQGGRAIYEGPPAGIMPTLARVGLEPPDDAYNAARFIVENAFLSEPADDEAFFHVNPGKKQSDDIDSIASSSSGEEDSEDEDDLKNGWDINNNNRSSLASLGKLATANALTRSLASIKDTLSGRELKIPEKENKKDKKLSSSRALLQIGGFKTLGGQLIKADKLTGLRQKLGEEQEDSAMVGSAADPNRLAILRRLNEIQRAAYYSRESPIHSIVLDLDNGKRLELHERAKSPVSSSGKGSSLEAATADSLLSGQDQASKSSSAESTSSSSLGASSERFNNDSFSGDNCARLRSRRDFDKRLSAKHTNEQRQLGRPSTLYQAKLLAHRTWLSIVRDPIFFGIQAFMHTTIPVLLALIFGSNQDEGCPRVGSFDLVQFAYANQHHHTSIGEHQTNQSMISDTVNSIRLSVGNVGIIFFEMFVLSFAINCITALVFPSDMFVLLKEYRNGWYSMSAYFMGRSLADLPLPVVLHSLAMLILCTLTKQPLDLWRLSLIILLVIMASLIAQSVGLTVGAILMRNSQSAVLAAAGIVAPFFALSGFIVRIHTLPWAAQWAAQASYLQHLLNGFIILRYGFNRCPCKEEDFEVDPGHQVPKQLHTMASLWVGTFNDEFNSNQNQSTALVNGTTRHGDPNIDIIERIMSSFKSANSFGHQMSSCQDVRPYAMLDFELHDADLLACFLTILFMILVSRLVTFGAIYYKVRSAT